MHYLKENRLQWGISQSDFAHLLGCKRSQLAMAETGERQLPYEATMMLLRMESTKADAHQPYKPGVATPDKNCLEALDHDLTGRYIKLYRQEKLCKHLFVKMQQCLHLIEMAGTMLQTEPIPVERTQRRLQLLEAEAKHNLPKWHKKWLLCQVEIAGQQAGMAKTKELMSGV